MLHAHTQQLSKSFNIVLYGIDFFSDVSIDDDDACNACTSHASPELIGEEVCEENRHQQRHLAAGAR